MRQAMFLIYECSLNADGLGLEDLDPYYWEQELESFYVDPEFEKEAA